MKQNLFKNVAVSEHEFALLRYHADNPGTPYIKLPPALRQRERIEAARKKGLLRRQYGPEKFYVTSKGYEVLSWLTKLQSHASETPAHT